MPNIIQIALSMSWHAISGIPHAEAQTLLKQGWRAADVYYFAGAWALITRRAIACGVAGMPSTLAGGLACCFGHFAGGSREAYALGRMLRHYISDQLRPLGSSHCAGCVAASSVG